jgi:signal transduction histidine kinase
MVGRLIPICNSKGDLVEILHLVHDITDRMDILKEKDDLAAKEKLTRASYEKIKIITDFIPIMIIQFRVSDWSVTFLNEFAVEYAKMNKGSAVHADSKVCEILSPESHEMVMKKAAIVLETKEKVEFVEELPWMDVLGRRGLIIVGALSPIKDKEGNIVEMLCLVKDVTEERRVLKRNSELVLREKIARESSRQKSEFLVHMSHELRTPLTGLLGLMDHLFSTIPMNKQQKLYAEEAKQSGEMLLLIINDILDLSKIEAGKLEIENHEFNITSLVDQACGLIKQGLVKNNVNLVVHVQNNIRGDFAGDPLRLKQMIVNLLSNAIKFSRKKPIALVIKEAYFVPREEELGCKLIEFSVEDQGIGISEESQQNLFKSFSQADVSTQRKYGGTGLGLSICQKLVTLMNGYISFESKEDCGSKFWFAVPLKEIKGSNDIRKITCPAEIKCADSLIDSTFRLAMRNVMPNETPTVSITECERGICIENFTQKTKDIHAGPIFYTWELFTPRNNNCNISKDANTAFTEEINEFTDELDFGGKVLIADDNTINRKVLCIMLCKLGIECEKAVNGREAIRMWETDSEIKLIFMDCLMPVLDGYEATKIIREKEKGTGKHIPIVAITANSLKEDEEKCYEIGMDSYLTKPFQKPKVLALLKSFSKNK